MNNNKRYASRAFLCLFHRLSAQPARALQIAVLLMIVASCSVLPPKEKQWSTYALPPTITGPLADTARAVSDKVDGHDAVLLVANAAEALDWRLALIDSAQASLDIQYFTWEDSASGQLLLRRLFEAADRGVRVRLMLDDLYLISSRSFTSIDAKLAAIGSHPNIDLRIFNPGKYRSGNLGIAGNYVNSFEEFNRRMHNKLFIADGHFALLGGRNVGDEYFGLDQSYNFLDMDVLISGPVTESMRAAFDIYWNSQPAYSALDMVSANERGDLAQLRVENDKAIEASMSALALFPLRPVSWKPLLKALPARVDAASTAFLQDTPHIARSDSDRLLQMIGNRYPRARSESIIVTPYLIPVGDFLAELTAMVASGVHVRVLTASLASGNHSAVHAHYKKYRRDILATGAELFEFRHDPSHELRALSDVPPVESEFISLHAKVAVSDRQRCFVGSLNLDPRALVLNTENGLIIESHRFCADLASRLEIMLAPENAWRVSLDGNDKLQWTSSSGTLAEPPARDRGQRAADFIYRWLPLEGLL